jgi:plasmid replication initiation protein
MAWSNEYMVPTDFARQLERERDEAREALEFRRELYTVQESYLELARRERDDWARLCGQYKQERDEALSKNTK